MRIFFVRHGEPDYEHDCLTERGRIQAEETAKRLSAEQISRIFASPMGRAQETAGYTARKLGLDIKTLDFMHEISWGSTSEDPKISEGNPWIMSYSFLSQNSDQLLSSSWRESKYFAGNKCVEFYDLISGKIDEFLADLGYKRDGNAYICAKNNPDVIALFSHGGSGACALSHILNLPFPYTFIVLPYGVCSITVIDFEPVREGMPVFPRISLFNDMNHMVYVKDEKLTLE